jgi:TetR/AcrR family transcriptional regulator, transcriptional repressor for nem operon
MRVSRAQAEENREAVINVASRLFREYGFEGIGLNDVMKAAGLTHGGFYKQFKSKEDLAVHACRRALDESVGKWSRVVVKAAGNPLVALVRFYLSPRHRRRVGEGCPIAALGSDAVRSSLALRGAFEAGVEAHLDILDRLLSVAPDGATRDRSIAILSMMVGALVLSRAVKDTALSQRIVEVAADETIARAIDVDLHRTTKSSYVM